MHVMFHVCHVGELCCGKSGANAALLEAICIGPRSDPNAANIFPSQRCLIIWGCTMYWVFRHECLLNRYHYVLNVLHQCADVNERDCTNVPLIRVPNVTHQCAVLHQCAARRDMPYHV